MNIKEKNDNMIYVNNIIETIKYFNWKLTQIWVEDNCIYAERIRLNGEKIDEGLYAGSDFNSQNVYDVFSLLKYQMNLNNMLNDDNILI
jgi:hypothetical protein